MAVEIEHKYLVNDTSFVQMATQVINIQQGYLVREPERTVRVRIADTNAYITIKGKGDGTIRPEFEYAIPLDDARQLLAMCLPTVIRKARHIVDFGGHRWEVDVYQGHLQGLVTAEIELPDASATYPLPPFVGHNVTGDPRYSNARLSDPR